MEILDAVRKGKIPAADIDAITIQRMRSDGSEQVSKGAIEIFGPAPGADRPALVRQALLGWPIKADASLAPNLRGLAHWTNEAWAIAILDPNRSVEEKYWVFQARTHEGQVLTGLKLREDESSMEWVDSNGRIENLNKADISELRESERSLMPEGFEQLLSSEEIAGIISYLRSSGTTKGE
jgi:putative heme-binding domain-containing protein